MDEFTQIALRIKELETCGELRVVYMEGTGAKAIAIQNKDKYVIAIDPSLSWEEQIKELWHEAKHICCHLGNLNYTKELAEKEAETFCNLTNRHTEIFNSFRADL